MAAAVHRLASVPLLGLACTNTLPNVAGHTITHPWAFPATDAEDRPEMLVGVGSGDMGMSLE
ncbi:hypothetical protein AOB60_05545 [Streptomyces noursei]|uniref:Uncharacterized protein n=1 Tax=Streptomyces noursei TaxID=1971 RepID=A0A2N8PH90_STRNR|nr:hypothetical protein AOB60_05545 [Streptomyces noursei]